MLDLDWYHQLGRDVKTDYVGLFNAKERLVDEVAALRERLAQAEQRNEELQLALNAEVRLREQHQRDLAVFRGGEPTRQEGE